MIRYLYQFSNNSNRIRFCLFIGPLYCFCILRMTVWMFLLDWNRISLIRTTFFPFKTVIVFLSLFSSVLFFIVLPYIVFNFTHILHSWVSKQDFFHILRYQFSLRKRIFELFHPDIFLLVEKYILIISVAQENIWTISWYISSKPYSFTTERQGNNRRRSIRWCSLYYFGNDMFGY